MDAVLDQDAALARVGGDHELLVEIAELFLEEYPGLLTTLAAAISNHDAYTVERTAHSLKGSIANFGAEAVRQVAFALEQTGRAGDLSGAARLLRELESGLTALHVELESL